MQAAVYSAMQTAARHIVADSRGTMHMHVICAPRLFLAHLLFLSPTR